MERKLIHELVPREGISEALPYGLRFDYHDRLLEASVEKNGILFPLLLVELPGDKAQLVSGHKRFSCVRGKLGERVPAYFVEEKFSERELFFLSVYSNWNQNFSDLDRMEILRKGERQFGLSPEELEREIFPAIGLPPGRSILEAYRRAAELVPEIHLLIQGRRLPFRGVSSLIRFSKEEQEFLARSVFHSLHLTSNELILFCDWLFDLKKMRKAPLEAVFEEESFQTILGNPALDPRTRGTNLFRAVRSLRFPKVSEAENEFRRLKDKFQEVEGICLERPRGLEMEGIELRARLKDRSSLAHVLQFLEAHRHSLESFF